MRGSGDQLLSVPLLPLVSFPYQDAEQTCLDALSEEPKPEICDMPCQTQLAVEPVQLSSLVEEFHFRREAQSLQGFSGIRA